MDQGDTLRNKNENRFNKLMANIDQSESEYSDLNDNELTDEESYDESDYSYETMSDGLAELLGDEARPLDEQTNGQSETGTHRQSSRSSIPDFQKYSHGDMTHQMTHQMNDETESPSDGSSRYPAIKLTFRDPVNISQLKTIQNKMREHGRLYGNSEIISENQLNIPFHEVDDAWKALQWIYNTGNATEGLRDFGSGLVLVTADYSPVAKWIPDFDGLFTIRITSPNIKKTNDLSFFITLSRFGQVKQLGIDSNYSYVLVRYAKQIDAEKAIIAIDRSFFFSSWCRAVKSHPLKGPLKSPKNISDIPHQKVHRKDVFVKANGHSLPRDSWKKLLALVSEAGQVTSLFGDSEGVVISFSDLNSAHKCYTCLQEKKFQGKTLIATKQFHIDELN